jgi:hypothetical protein
MDTLGIHCERFGINKSRAGGGHQVHELRVLHIIKVRADD